MVKKAGKQPKGRTIAKQIEREPNWLREFREKAASDSKALPFENSELFKKYADANSVEWEKYGVRRYAGEYGKPENGVVLCSISKAIEKYESKVKQHLKTALSSKNKFTAMNEANFSDGYFLLVKEGVKLEKPIMVRNEIEGKNALVAHRNIVILEKNASAKIFEENYSGGGEHVFSNNTDFSVGEGANLTYSTIGFTGKNSIFVSQKEVKLAKNAKSSLSAGFYGGKMTFSALDTIMEGDNSSGEDYEVIFGSGTQKFNITSNITNIGRNSSGKVAAKSVFKDESRGVFKGMAHIGKNAKNSTSYLAGHAILLGANASSDAIPGLKIENNDVRATHSASVAQLDESQMFYLKSRGLPDALAKRMIVEGFVSPILRQIGSKEAVERLRALFGVKWDGLKLSEMGRALNEMKAAEMHENSSKSSMFEGHYKYR